MKKIILAFDGIHFSEGAFELACSLNELSPILLTGVFLPQAELADSWGYAMNTGGHFITPTEFNTEGQYEINVERFEKLCQQNNIDYRVHKDENGFALSELKLESVFADLLILGSETYYKSMGTEKPNDYLMDALHEVSCPVLLTPENYQFPKSVILSYDGTDDAVYAIKQFSYLFPELRNKNTVLVYANEDTTADFPNKILIEELATQHFPDLTFYKLDANPKKFFTTWLTEMGPAVLVSGSYGRSDLSRVFHKSFVNEIIADHKIPLFIAHR